MPTYKEMQRYAAELRELADFIEEHGVKLPEFWMNTSEWINLTATDYDNGETKMNDANTKENIRQFLDAVGECEKDYSEDRILITKRYKSTGNVMLKGEVDRSIICKRVVKGQKVIPATEEKVIDDVEWVCADGVSLLKLVNS